MTAPSRYPFALRLMMAIASITNGCGCLPSPVVTPERPRKPDTEISQIVETVLEEIAADHEEPQEAGPPVVPLPRPDSGGTVAVDSRPVVTVYLGDVRTCVPCKQFADWEAANRATAPFRFEVRTDVPAWLQGTPTFTFKGRDGQVRYAEPIGWRGIGPLVESYSTWGGGK